MYVFCIELAKDIIKLLLSLVAQSYYTVSEKNYPQLIFYKLKKP